MRLKPFVLQTKMLYLEDYLEMIEHLPIELRDRFTEMREIDLGVENTVDSLEVQNHSLGSHCDIDQPCRPDRKISSRVLQA